MSPLHYMIGQHLGLDILMRKRSGLTRAVVCPCEGHPLVHNPCDPEVRDLPSRRDCQSGVDLADSAEAREEKRPTLTWPRLLMRMLLGLMSRWIWELEWISFRPLVIW